MLTHTNTHTPLTKHKYQTQLALNTKLSLKLLLTHRKLKGLPNGDDFWPHLLSQKKT